MCSHLLIYFWISAGACQVVVRWCNRLWAAWADTTFREVKQSWFRLLGALQFKPAAEQSNKPTAYAGDATGTTPAPAAAATDHLCHNSYYTGDHIVCPDHAECSNTSAAATTATTTTAATTAVVQSAQPTKRATAEDVTSVGTNVYKYMIKFIHIMRPSKQSKAKHKEHNSASPQTHTHTHTLRNTHTHLQ